MEELRIKHGTDVDLGKINPDDTSLFKGNKSDAEKLLQDLSSEICRYQQILFAQHTQKLLIIIQAMDTGGKDGTIRKVFSGVNPQGVRVANFKAPTQDELDHDFLWRIHQQVPAKGEMVIFNRSQYEDVLVVRVHSLVSEKRWKKRYEQINSFEKMLHDEGTTILKFFLHIDKKEQKKRLEARIKEPSKHWKFNSGDLRERALWGQYMTAYQDVLSKTSTPWAPWYVIPSNHKWFRNIAVASIITSTLKKLDMHYPPPEDGLDEIIVE